MPTSILRVDPNAPAADAIARAAHVLQSGGLVAFPTETVYGLGANALDSAAVAKIFAAKGRPASNPIIVHIAAIEDAKALAGGWPEVARKLAERFWPGPLTLVLPKQAHVSDLVTAGGPTVALRMPAHPVALALLRACGLPLAAPSANRSSELSPTLPEHVLRGLADRIDLLLDAGATNGGLESTVLDVTTHPAAGLLRWAGDDRGAGSAARPNRARQCGAAGRWAVALAGPVGAALCSKDASGDCRCKPQSSRGIVPAKWFMCVGWLTHVDEPAASVSVVRIVLPGVPASYAAQLYAALHRLDDARLDRIVVEAPPTSDDWLAIHDRLRRAGSA